MSCRSCRNRPCSEREPAAPGLPGTTLDSDQGLARITAGPAPHRDPRGSPESGQPARRPPTIGAVGGRGCRCRAAVRDRHRVRELRRRGGGDVHRHRDGWVRRSGRQRVAAGAGRQCRAGPAGAAHGHHDHAGRRRIGHRHHARRRAGAHVGDRHRADVGRAAVREVAGVRRPWRRRARRPPTASRCSLSAGCSTWPCWLRSGTPMPLQRQRPSQPLMPSEEARGRAPARIRVPPP